MNTYKTDSGEEILLTAEQAKQYGTLSKLTLVNVGKKMSKVTEIEPKEEDLTPPQQPSE